MKCPGQDMRYWKPGDIFEVDCPHCGNKVEFFKDEASRRCRSCKNMVVNPRMNFGCAAYCQYAAQCLGELGPELLAKRNDFLKDRIAVEVKRQLGRDFQAIGHVALVARRVEEIALAEKAEPAIVLCAAYLHVLFEPRVDGPSLTGEQAARSIMGRLSAGADLVDKVMDTIDRFLSGNADDSVNAKVLLLAHRLAVPEEEQGKPKLAPVIT
jgi:hypothetical protein